MPDSRHTIKFPPHLASEPVPALADPLPADEFVELHVQSARAIYAKADKEREEGYDLAVSANFLRVFVDLIDSGGQWNGRRAPLYRRIEEDINRAVSG